VCARQASGGAKPADAASGGAPAPAPVPGRRQSHSHQLAVQEVPAPSQRPGTAPPADAAAARPQTPPPRPASTPAHAPCSACAPPFPATGCTARRIRTLAAGWRRAPPRSLVHGTSECFLHVGHRGVVACAAEQPRMVFPHVGRQLGRVTGHSGRHRGVEPRPVRRHQVPHHRVAVQQDSERGRGRACAAAPSAALPSRAPSGRATRACARPPRRRTPAVATPPPAAPWTSGGRDEAKWCPRAIWRRQRGRGRANYAPAGRTLALHRVSLRCRPLRCRCKPCQHPLRSHAASLRSRDMTRLPTPCTRGRPSTPQCCWFVAVRRHTRRGARSVPVGQRRLGTAGLLCCRPV
jgi:hypothetical protein